MKNAESYLVRREIYQSSRTVELAKDNAELSPNNGSEQWIELVRAWEIALNLAQSEQCQLIHSMHGSYSGTGENPTVEQINKVDELWASEKQARAAMDAFISERFGLATIS